jgi:hypothetical protein
MAHGCRQIGAMVCQNAAETAVGDHPWMDFCSMMARYDGMMKHFGSTAGFHGNQEIFMNSLQNRSHGTCDALGIKEIIVRLKKTDRTSVVLLGLDQIFFTASNNILVSRQQRNQIVGSGVKVAFSFFEFFLVSSEFVKAGLVF